MLRTTQQFIMQKQVEEGCRMILADLNKDMKELQKYKIPPPFFGPIAAVQASKSFQDDHFQQYDIECMNYIVEPDSNAAKPGATEEKKQNEEMSF